VQDALGSDSPCECVGVCRGNEAVLHVALEASLNCDVWCHISNPQFLLSLVLQLDANDE